MTEKQGRIRLRSGEYIITQRDDVCYHLLKGSIGLYIAPLESERPKKRQFLLDADEGTFFPGFCYNDGEYDWRFVIAARDDCELQISHDPIAIKESQEYIERNLPLKDLQLLGFEEAISEQYRLSRVKDDAFIYQTAKDDVERQYKGLQRILNVFSRSSSAIVSDDPTKSILYDTVRYICRAQKIALADYSTVVNCAGYAFNVEDVARISDFIARKVTLTDGWHQKDVGIFLGLRKDDGRPVVCEPVNSKRFRIVDLSDHSKTIVTDCIAASLQEHGFVFSRPFPAKPLSIKGIFQYAAKDVRWRDIAIYAAMALLGVVVGVVIPEVNRMIYDQYIPFGDESALLQIAWFALSFIIANMCFQLVKGIASSRWMFHIQHNLQGAVYHRLFNLPPSFFRSYDSGDLAGRAMGVSEIISTIIQMLVSNVITLLLSLVYLARMFSYAGSLAVFALLMLTIYIALKSLLTALQTKHEKKKAAMNGTISSMLFQYLDGLEKIRLSGSENSAMLRYLNVYSKFKQNEHKSNLWQMLASVLAMAAPVVFTIVFFALIGGRNLQISPGIYIAFSGAFGALSGAVLSLSEAISGIVKLKPVLDRAKPLLNTVPESEGGKDFPGKLDGQIELSNVSFSYDGEHATLKDINLQIKPGEYVGIVGPSGSGKSTLMKLLLGFELPNEGKIYFSGHDLVSLNKRELRKNFGIVLQHGKLITGSINENMTITAPEVNMDRVLEIVEKVGLKDDIAQMPMGLHTMVSDDGGTISGGQKQRILIARALVNNPTLVFFDEATSALDNITQSIVGQTLEKLHSTRIVIAHRMSTVANCNRIIVLNCGRIIEEGSHAELLAKNGLYYQLSQRQTV